MEDMEFSVPEDSFIQIPSGWMFDMNGDDYRRLSILLFRFRYFADIAFEEGRDIKSCYYESQKTMCMLFGMSEKSRTKVGEFLKRMETAGYLTVDRQRMKCDDGWQVRHYIVVNEPRLLFKYGL